MAMTTCASTPEKPFLVLINSARLKKQENLFLVPFVFGQEEEEKQNPFLFFFLLVVCCRNIKSEREQKQNSSLIRIRIGLPNWRGKIVLVQSKRLGLALECVALFLPPNLEIYLQNKTLDF